MKQLLYKDFDVTDGKATIAPVSFTMEIVENSSGEKERAIIIQRDPAFGDYGGAAVIYTEPTNDHNNYVFDYIWLDGFAYAIYNNTYCSLRVLKISPEGVVEDITTKDPGIVCKEGSSYTGKEFHVGEGWICPFQLYIPIAQDNTFTGLLEKYQEDYDVLFGLDNQDHSLGRWCMAARKPKWALMSGTFWGAAHSGEFVWPIDISRITEGIIRVVSTSIEIMDGQSLERAIDSEDFWYDSEEDRVHMSVLSYVDLSKAKVIEDE